MHREDESSLIERVKAGERQLFIELVQPYENNVLLESYSILQNKADAEDAAQETFLKALAHLDQLRSGENFRAWLLQIAVNEARMRQRKDRKYVTGSEDQNQGEEIGTIDRPFRPRDFSAWADNPLQIVERKELWAAVSRALDSLSAPLREVFVLRDMQHCSAEETAKILGISSASVNTRLHRARLQMRERLAPLFRQPKAAWTPLRMVMDMGKRYIRRVVSCGTVIGELSNLIDGNLDPQLRARLEEHLRLCQRCSILLDTSRRLLYIVGDEKLWTPPFEHSKRVKQSLPGRAETA